MIFENKELEELILDLSIKAGFESTIHPVDREFLENHLEEILAYNPIEFIYYNLKSQSSLYTMQLFVCLPELWETITLEELLEMSEHFDDPLSFFTLIRFTYKYIEIDIIEPILKTHKVSKDKRYFDQIIEYLDLQWNVLIKTESDLEDFEDGFINVDYNKWIYIKQKFLLDNRIKPALISRRETHLYINKLIKKYNT